MKNKILLQGRKLTLFYSFVSEWSLAQKLTQAEPKIENSGDNTSCCYLPAIPVWSTTAVMVCSIKFTDDTKS